MPAHRASPERAVVLVLGPHRAALSGVAAHVNRLLGSPLAEEFTLLHFQVGSEGRSEGALARWARLLVAPIALAATIGARGAAIVHLNSSLNCRAFWRDALLAAVARLCGARVLLQVHGGALPREFCGGRASRAALVRAVLRLADAIVVLARCEFDAYRQFIPDRFVVLIPNAVDAAPYGRVTHGTAGPGVPLRLVYLGRLARGKGLDELLQGLLRARARGVDARLALAGSGEEELRLRKLVAGCGLDPYVAFVGPVRGDRKLRLLAAADLSVLPSYSEGLPYSLLECMAAGLPVIASPVGAIPDVLVDGVHGLFVTPRDAESVARAIVQMARDRRALARMGAAARVRVASAFTVRSLAAAFSRLYGELCVGRRRWPLARS